MGVAGLGLQTAIQSDGFRSLADGEEVEFFIETSDDGRQKAVQVSGPGGANVKVGGWPFKKGGGRWCGFKAGWRRLCFWACCSVMYSEPSVVV